jgi:hypothetical protein
MNNALLKKLELISPALPGSNEKHENLDHENRSQIRTRDLQTTKYEC